MNGPSSYLGCLSGLAVVAGVAYAQSPPVRPEPLIIPAPKIGQNLLELQDINSDGVPDLLFESWYGDLAAGLGTVARNAAGFWRNGPGTGRLDGYFTHIGPDLDADGRRDAVFFQSGVGFLVFEVGDSGLIEQTGFVPSARGVAGSFLTDGDGDGDLDIGVVDSSVSADPYFVVFDQVAPHLFLQAAAQPVIDGRLPNGIGQLDASGPAEWIGAVVVSGTGLVIDTYPGQGPLQWGPRVRTVFKGFDAYAFRRTSIVPDMTGDGRSDLIVALADPASDNSSTDIACYVFSGRADGRFQYAATVVDTVTAGRDDVLIVPLGDVSGDGLADVAIGTRPFIGSSSALASPPRTWVLASGATPTGVAMPELFGLCKGSFAVMPGQPQWLVGFRPDAPDALTGAYTAVTGLSAPKVLEVIRGAFRDSIAREATVSVRDLNADGLGDLIVRDVDRALVAQAVDTGDEFSFLTAPSGLGLDAVRRIDAVRLNGFDRSLLAVVGTSGSEGRAALWSFGDDGSVSEVWSLAAPVLVRGVAAGDLDGDGRTDLAVVAYGPDDASVIALYLGTDSGGFEPSGTITVSADGIGAPGQILIDDFDADGRPDLLIRSSSFTLGDDLAQVLWNQGGLAFSSPLSIGPNGMREPVQAIASDLDADGRTELLIAASRDINASVFSLDPVTGVTLRSAVDIVGTPLAGALLADADGDGLRDLVLARQSGLIVAKGLGDASFETPSEVPVGSTKLALAAFDTPGGTRLVVADAQLNAEIYRWADQPVAEHEISVPARPDFLASLDGPSGPVLVAVSEDGRMGRLLPSIQPCPPDLAAPFGTLNIFDIQAYLGLYNTQDPAADLAEPIGVFNIFDLQAYIVSFNAGCP